MKSHTILVAVAGLLIGGGGVYVVTHAPMGHDHDMADMMHEHSDDERANTDMPMGDMNGMDHSMMMVSSEREFLTGMIPHHQEAVDTAKEVLARGGSTPGIKTLAENIIIAQEKEIADMKQWYQDWYGEPYVETGEYAPMMRELENLSGAELDRVFLSDMIMHHMGAIMMAQSVQPYIEHQEITDLSAAIVGTQAREITLMRDLLKDL